MSRRKREPCPAGIEDRCPIPRYRCREVGEPGRHCFELFVEFEAFVFPDAEPTPAVARRSGPRLRIVEHEIEADSGGISETGSEAFQDAVRRFIERRTRR